MFETARIQLPSPPSADQASPRPRVVVVGGGPAGVRVAQDLLRLGTHEVVVLSDERWQSYNRIKLTPLLAGDIQVGQVYQPLIAAPDAPIRQYRSHRVVAIDRDCRTVTDHHGRVWPYDRLVLATGSRPRTLPVPGIDLPGVFTFRGLDSTEALIARSFRSRSTVVIGGGLLGLEAARGMSRRGVPTTIIEHENRLMARQLDERGAGMLQREIEALGIRVEASATLAAIMPGENGVAGIRLAGGREIACDTIIVCTGIRANAELAQQAGLKVGKGVVIDDALRTSDPHIYAIGECAEHEGTIYGLVGPGLEQAGVAARHIATGQGSYAGSVPTTKLKAVGVPVFSMGDVDQLETRTDVETAIYAQDGGYRRIVLAKGVLVGAIGIGEWPGLNRLQEALARRARLYPWHVRRFRADGNPWPVDEGATIHQWPAATTVCNCTGVTKGQLSGAVAGGCVTLESLRQRTSASTVCGTCTPLLQELLGQPAKAEPVPWRRTLLALSLLTLVLASAMAWMPPLAVPASFSTAFRVEQLWVDGLYKQISGFTLLGLGAIAALLSIRKRWRRFTLGGYGGWRAAHAALGATTLVVLAAHTGFDLGDNLNLWLVASFAVMALLGFAAGAATSLQHRLGRGADVRSMSLWLHILASWPLPVLLTFHILSVYAF
ncbi:MAG: FAD-dependent oxidoreductase [Sphingomonadales bacterium]